MRFTNVEQVNQFLATIKQCSGDVWLESIEGDRFNLKSAMSTYVAMGALLAHEGDNLELFCSNKDDEALLLRYFQKNPEVNS